MKLNQWIKKEHPDNVLRVMVGADSAATDGWNACKKEVLKIIKNNSYKHDNTDAFCWYDDIKNEIEKL